MSDIVGLNAKALRSIARGLDLRTDGSAARLLKRIAASVGVRLGVSEARAMIDDKTALSREPFALDDGGAVLHRPRRKAGSRLACSGVRPMSNAEIAAAAEESLRRAAKRRKQLAARAGDGHENDSQAPRLSGLRRATVAWAKRQQAGGGVVGTDNATKLSKADRKFIAPFNRAAEKQKAAAEAERKRDAERARTLHVLAGGNFYPLP